MHQDPIEQWGPIGSSGSTKFDKLQPLDEAHFLSSINGKWGTKMKKTEAFE